MGIAGMYWKVKRANTNVLGMPLLEILPSKRRDLGVKLDMHKEEWPQPTINIIASVLARFTDKTKTG
jgi:hypothetical protein